MGVNSCIVKSFGFVTHVSSVRDVTFEEYVELYTHDSQAESIDSISSFNVHSSVLCLREGMRSSFDDTYVFVKLIVCVIIKGGARVGECVEARVRVGECVEEGVEKAYILISGGSNAKHTSGPDIGLGGDVSSAKSYEHTLSSTGVA